MEIVIKMLNKDIPKHQEVIDIHLHFIDGHIVDADGYGFVELPKGHGDLIDRNELKKHKYHDNARYENAVAVAQIDWADAIIEADTESEGEG